MNHSPYRTDPSKVEIQNPKNFCYEIKPYPNGDLHYILDFDIKKDENVRGIFGVDDEAKAVKPIGVIYNPPATIVYWNDDTKTIVKCAKGDTYNKLVGLLLCYIKKSLGNDQKTFNHFVNIFMAGKPNCRIDDRTELKKKKNSKISVNTESSSIVYLSADQVASILFS